jgi:hypothetical protein
MHEAGFGTRKSVLKNVHAIAMSMNGYTIEKRIGRPSAVTPEIAQEILVRIADGQSLAITRDKSMPSERSIYIAHFTSDRANTESKRLREWFRLCRATGSRIHNRLSGKPRLTTELQR